MSVIDLILGQQLIVMSIAFAGILLAGAIFLMLYFRLRKMLSQRTRRKVQRAEARAAGIVAADLDLGSLIDVPFPVTEDDIERPAALAPQGRHAVQSAPIQAQAIAAQPQPNAQAAPQAQPQAIVQQVPAEQQPTETPSSEHEGAPSSAMQDLIESVFVDEEAQARMESLLSGTEDIKADDLVELSRDLAQQLRARFAPLAE